MSTKLYEISFEYRDVYQQGVELINTARIATEAVHGITAVRLETFNWYDDQTMRLLIDSSACAGRTMLQILTSLLDEMIGEEYFTVCHAQAGDTERVDYWKRRGFAASA